MGHIAWEPFLGRYSLSGLTTRPREVSKLQDADLDFSNRSKI